MRIDLLNTLQLVNACSLVPGGDELMGCASFMAGEGMAFAYMSDDVLVGVAGVSPHWKGVGELWALMNPDTFQSLIGVRKCGLSMVRQAFSGMKLHRIQSDADMGLPYHARWLESLGFELEGVMKNYTTDRKDMARYALVKEDI